MKKKRIIIAGMLVFLIVSCCFTIITSADIHEKENIIVKPYDIESEWMLWIGKDKEIQFNVTSNISVHIYIMTSDAYRDIGYSSPYDENDFNVNLVEKKNVQEASFTWTKPDDQTYYLVIFNPNNSSAMISYSYTETLFEELGEAFFEIGEICVGTVCLILVVFDLIISLIIALWIYKDAKERGKNGAVWGVIGFILNIIGLIIWLIVRPSISEKPTTKTSDRRCPACGRIIPEDARTCPYCSKKFQEF